jgi:histidinol-phosphate/aromatic aminotransferase/cobyric acid decarboxylase-like protein
MPYFPASAKYSLPYRAVVMRQQRENALRPDATKVTVAGEGRAPIQRTRPEAQPCPAAKVAAGQDDFGAQRGDLNRGVDMDLSTCVNRYGPAPAALEALHSIEPADLLLHPCEAAQQVVDLYRWATGVPGGAMIPGPGVSEFIWAMGRELDHANVYVPLPADTDCLKAFPGRGFSLDGEQTPTVEQVNAALDTGGVVIISNPHNPTGVHLDPEDLIAAAAAHPAATLVVDESYVGFTPDPIGRSAIGCDVPNLVVLRSTSKFYGIVATRAGIAWCAEPDRLNRLFGRQESWGLSGVDARVACAAVRDFHWSSHTRRRIQVDNAWLGRTLADIPCLEPRLNSNVHFQYAFSAQAKDVAATFADHGIGVRVLGVAHGVSPNALRIVAPRPDERGRFAAAVAEVSRSSGQRVM